MFVPTIFLISYITVAYIGYKKLREKTEELEEEAKKNKKKPKKIRSLSWFDSGDFREIFGASLVFFIQGVVVIIRKLKWRLS